MSPATRGTALALALLVGGCGGERDDSARFDPFREVQERPAERPARSSPRWETIATLSGSGSAREPFTVARGAIQWRARWRCDRGRITLSLRAPLVDDARCPGTGVAGDVRSGELTLDVDAAGPWRVVVQQQVDTPLREPPLPAMRSRGARLLARGGFHGIERRGRGTAALYRLPGGRLALRFDRFSTSANSDLFVWLSTADDPRTTVAAARARHTVLAPLKSTLGAQNYLLPRGIAASSIRSVVIWCVPVRIAYAAATLRRP